MSDPVLRVKLTDGADKPLATFEFRIQADVSPKLAKSIVAELLPKKIKAAVDTALPALGFK